MPESSLEREVYVFRWCIDFMSMERVSIQEAFKVMNGTSLDSDMVKHTRDYKHAQFRFEPASALDAMLAIIVVNFAMSPFFRSCQIH